MLKMKEEKQRKEGSSGNGSNGNASTLIKKKQPLRKEDVDELENIGFHDEVVEVGKKLK